MDEVDSLLANEVTLAEVLDRAIHKGVFLRGEVVVSLADIDLIYISLQLVLSSVALLQSGARRPGTIASVSTGSG